LHFGGRGKSPFKRRDRRKLQPKEENTRRHDKGGPLARSAIQKESCWEKAWEESHREKANRVWSPLSGKRGSRFPAT